MKEFVAAHLWRALDTWSRSGQCGDGRHNLRRRLLSDLVVLARMRTHERMQQWRWDCEMDLTCAPLQVPQVPHSAVEGFWEKFFFRSGNLAFVRRSPHGCEGVQVRQQWAFYRDRRPEAYGPLVKQ
jgi:hypothetical protein